MDTIEKQAAFFDEHWPAMKQAAESGGADAVIDWIRGHTDPVEQRVLFYFARRGLMQRDWEGKNLDDYIAVVEAGIETILQMGEQSDDPKVRDARKDTANVMSYNLAADLADCWADDGLTRTRRHFEVGRSAADRCIRMRAELNKGPWPHSIAHWVKGMHCMSLDDLDAATEHFGIAVDYARQLAQANHVEESESFNFIICTAYLSFARWLQGDNNAKHHYDQAIATFDAQLRQDEKKEDAEIGLEQLRAIKERYGRDSHNRT